ncbi:TPA: glycosyltransferase family 2 protein [Legionella pneumophila]|uniref:Glycosyltransferase n=3 Tax=Legionella pneumophila TaxID=446 RepID=Q5ZVN4_LEGPH|nr:glycosyltransferase [Legionella pneumophila subsp. pneumophila str. Philadelphia 1]AEW51609.1 glycosyltransferase [Legionella pneumophila subsp. pneumophila ATCC 43290]PNL78228.1 glycosyltransferase family 2 protein [Legionella pneumophila subsp. pneumophila]PPK33811.1 glycosyltransferase family 2 protein [Legionella pneumophila]OOD05504.1 glycosyl transferase [Legionella pneumophila subsp. pneumophila ATCC 43290]
MISMPKEKVVIIIPTYNEEDNISNTIDLILKETYSLADYQVDILVFDSHSTDSTAHIVRELTYTSQRIHFAQEPQKTGLGSAYLQAMRIAIDELNADVVFEFDADGSHQPCYIAPMLELLKQHDVVVGSRYISGGRIPSNWAFHRKLLSVGGNWVARMLLTGKYKDLTSGLRAIRTNLLKKLLPSNFLSNNYAYKLELYWLLHKAKARIVEFPIQFIDREKGKSKLPKNSMIDTLRVLFTLRFRELRQYLTMCCVGSIGALIQFSLYNWLRSSNHSALVSSQVAISAAIISNFIFHHSITFKQKTDFRITKTTFSRFTQFIIYSTFMVYFQSLWVHIFVHSFGQGVLKENIIVASGLGIGSIINYLFYSNIIWSSKGTHSLNSNSSKETQI